MGKHRVQHREGGASTGSRGACECRERSKVEALAGWLTTVVVLPFVQWQRVLTQRWSAFGWTSSNESR